MRKIALIFVFLLLSGLLPAHAGGLEIGRMRVALWPEYDSTGVLFIYDGRFRNAEDFPNETAFILPEGSVVSDACSLSPKGQHFCQLYTQKKSPDGGELLSLRLPYPNFYLSFHTDPFRYIKPGDKRVLKHVIKANHFIETLEVDVQTPLRAQGFGISPEGYTGSEKKGFTHWGRVYENVEKGTEIEVSIEYTRPDIRPSVDIKYSPMSQREEKAAPHQRQGSFMTYVYVFSAVGVVVVIALVALLVKSRER